MGPDLAMDKFQTGTYVIMKIYKHILLPSIQFAIFIIH